ncbi:hypothetical protein [Caballeronia zhejiangensis]|uniref:Uncharacterized protein n=1 Tax=Caballeronia zhejiangensis TaxID=871203 RepID=A0A656QEG0_9BURK|nr:hypothetical protein [Caballeronia zhejiangensis]KDR25951.1 hypothetical protein BG60_26405 [Caballeronia zhejiangensis]
MTEREQFEKWAGERKFNLARYGEGEYAFLSTSEAWDAWQASRVALNAAKPKLCTICNGYGRYQDGHSGRESDGYAPNIVECECADEERLQDPLAVLGDIAKLKRYNPNHLKRKVPYPVRHMTINMPVELFARIDAAIAQAEPSSCS